MRQGQGLTGYSRSSRGTLLLGCLRQRMGKPTRLSAINDFVGRVTALENW